MPPVLIARCLPFTVLFCFSFIPDSGHNPSSANPGNSARFFSEALLSPSAPAMATGGGLTIGKLGVSKGPATRRNISPVYKSVEEVYAQLKNLRNKFPDLVHLEQIGKTAGLNLPILALKVSRNPDESEDEPKILFTGVHHAREPIGASITLHLINTLCEKYGVDDDVSRWLRTTEIWFVPIVNPDGYKYIFDNDLGFPWWRKNLRDNDRDGRFNPLHDGVDLNRNYGFNWKEGGEGKPNSWFFHGPAPFSENETQAIMDLAKRENFAMGVSYHSYGESVLYPWGNFRPPPDLDLIVDIAGNMARKIRRQTGQGTYAILPLNGRAGQSSVWMYATFGTIDFIVEVGTAYFPAARHVPAILAEHTKGAFYLLDRLHREGIKGHVVDVLTKQPLQATVEVLKFNSEHVRPRVADQTFGSFYRLLCPGEYALRITKHGYTTKTLEKIIVEKRNFTEIDIALARVDPGSNGH